MNKYYATQCINNNYRIYDSNIQLVWSFRLWRAEQLYSHGRDVYVLDITFIYAGDIITSWNQLNPENQRWELDILKDKKLLSDRTLNEQNNTYIHLDTDTIVTIVFAQNAKYGW